MTQAIATIPTLGERLSTHYRAVKARLGVPVRSGHTNNKDELIALGKILKEEEQKAKLQRAIERKERLAAEGFIGHNSRNAPRPDVEDVNVRRKGLPFDELFYPELVEPVDIILSYFGVTWSEIVGPSRIKVVSACRGTVIAFLIELGASPYALAKLFGRDESTIRSILTTNGASLRDVACFAEATSCANNNGLDSLSRWKIPASKTAKRKDA